MTPEPAFKIPKTADQAGRLPATSAEELDAAARRLAERRRVWARLPVNRRIALLDQLIESFGKVSERWAEACLEAEGIPPANPAAGEEWIAGPYLVLRNLRLLRKSLSDIAEHGKPKIPGPITERPDGTVVAQVFPYDGYDRILYSGVTAEVWMEADVTREGLADSQAVAYGPDAAPSGGVALVLGAGNVSSIGPMDALYKLFVESRVVLFKAHPVNDYLGPLLEEGFAPLRAAGFLEVVYGGGAVGAYLCQHAEVDEIHVTGSDKTVEAIVFGPGDDGARRKARGTPLNDRPISSELGNVSPVLVVPGPWSASDLAYQAENLVSSLTNNAGFNCNASRVVLTSTSWRDRRPFLIETRQMLKRVATRRAWYPGAEERWQSFVDRHPEAECYGDQRYGRLPWTLIPELSPLETDEPCFTTEAFCGVFAEVPLASAGPVDFLAAAVRFCNENLWGTLNATILVHPATLKDLEVAAAFDDALDELRYGTISINHWAAVGYGLVVPPWGGHPGSELTDVQSGQGFVHNTLMFSRPRKTVVRAPFRVRPKPAWFATHRTADELGKKLVSFEAAPSPWKLPGIFKLALKG